MNQITQRGVPGAADQIGAAYADATVTVNDNAAYRKGEYYQYALALSNGSAPVWQVATNKAVKGGNTVPITNNVLCPPATQTLTYDLDGNLTNDLVWSLKWDGENRLIEATNVANVPNAGKKKLAFAYDHLGRRVRKTVYPWSGSNYSTTPSEDLQFVYDGWNLVAELNATNKTVLRSYTWGSDLSGDMESAGGIGGLVMQRDHTGGGSHHFVGYDGNGNVTALVSGADSAVTAVYEHGPFGEPIRASGLQAKANPFRWSTKFTDGETDLVYYGYRYYSASLGRWINRDPIAEDGGINLYAMVMNNLQSWVDTLGESGYRADVTHVGVDIHDTVDGERINYGFHIDENGKEQFYERGGKHRGQAPKNLVQKSMANLLSDPNRMRVMHDKITALHGGGEWPDSFRDGPNGQRLRLTGRWLRRFTAGTGAALGFLAVLNVATASQDMAMAAKDYGKFMKQGDTAFADLAAIELAVNVQNLGNNYFVTMYALDLLLTD